VRIAFFGLPLAACLLVRDGHDVVLAVLSPVAGPGRRRLTRLIGEQRVLDAGELGPALDEALELARERVGFDLLVSWYWTRRLSPEWIEGGPLGSIGAHPSLLPRHRGPNPFFWAIDAGDAESGVSVHRLTERYDEGPVLAQTRIPIGQRNSWQLARALDRPSLSCLRETVSAFAAGAPPAEQAQDESLASWAPEPEGAALKVEWSWPTERVLRRIRALAPVPGLALELCGVRFFVTVAEAASEIPRLLQPGEALAMGDPAREILVRTGDGAIRIVEAVAGAGSSEEGEFLPLADLAQLVASRTRGV